MPVKHGTSNQCCDSKDQVLDIKSEFYITSWIQMETVSTSCSPRPRRKGCFILQGECQRTSTAEELWGQIGPLNQLPNTTMTLQSDGARYLNPVHWDAHVTVLAL